MKTVLAYVVIAFSSLLPTRDGQVSPIAPSTQIADAIAWYDTLGLPNASGLPYVHAATGRWLQTGNQPRENTYVDGFLLRDDPDAFVVFVSDVPGKTQLAAPFEPFAPLSTVRLVKTTAGPLEQPVGIEAIDFQHKADDVLEHLRGAAGEDSFSWHYWPWSLRVRVFAFARACLQRGLRAEGEALMDIAAHLADANTREPPTRPLRDLLQREMGDATWWETAATFGDPSVPWAAILQTYEDFGQRFPVSDKVHEAAERAALLQTMAAEDAEHHAEPFDAIPPAAQVAEAIYQLRNTHIGCWVRDEHYPVMTEKQDGRDVITPVHRLVDLGDAAVPALVEALDDQRFTRSMADGCARTATPRFPPVMRVSDFAQRILEHLAGRNFSIRKTDDGKVVGGTTRQQAEAWWADKQAKGERQALIEHVSGGGQNSVDAARKLVRLYPDAALDAIEAGVRVTDNGFVRGELVTLTSGLTGNAALAFLRSRLAPSEGIPTQVAAATILFNRHQPEAVPAMIEAWRTIQLRLPGNRGGAYDEVGTLILFLAKSGDAAAIDALGRNLTQAPVDVRMALLNVFLPRAHDAGSSVTGQMVSIMDVDPDGFPFPAGPAGVAVERLVVASLDDRDRRLGMKGHWNDVTFEDPRICDLAALVLSQRWPAKYQFRWSANATDCDRQIDVMRNTSRGIR